MSRILLVRHGHVTGIAPGRFRGRSDLALTELGLRQAGVTADWIAAHWQPAAVYSSPLQRCRVTAQHIATACAVPCRISACFNDLDYGDWQGRTHAQVLAASPLEYRHWRDMPELHRFPGGESLLELAARIADGLRDVLEAHPDDTVVIVGHDSGIRTALLRFLELPLSAYRRIELEPCGISEIVVESGGTTVWRINETAHLARTADPRWGTGG